MTAITVAEGNTNFSASGGVLYETYTKNGTKVTEFVCIPKGITGSVTILSGITRIKSGYFANCEKITEVVLPSSVTCIEPEAFTSCTALTSVKWKDTIGEKDGSSVFLTNGNQTTMVSWKSSQELARLLKGSCSDKYLGNPKK